MFQNIESSKNTGITEYVLSVTAQVSFRDARHSWVSFIDILTNELLREIVYLSNFHRLLLL